MQDFSTRNDSRQDIDDIQRIGIRVSKKDRQRIDKAIGKTGQTRSEYIRELVSQGPVVVSDIETYRQHPPFSEYIYIPAAVVRSFEIEIIRQGNNFRQIYLRVYAAGSAELTHEYPEIMAAFNELRNCYELMYADFYSICDIVYSIFGAARIPGADGRRVPDLSERLDVSLPSFVLSDLDGKADSFGYSRSEYLRLAIKTRAETVKMLGKHPGATCTAVFSPDLSWYIEELIECGRDINIFAHSLNSLLGNDPENARYGHFYASITQASDLSLYASGYLEDLKGAFEELLEELSEDFDIERIGFSDPDNQGKGNTVEDNPDDTFYETDWYEGL